MVEILEAPNLLHGENHGITIQDDHSTPQGGWFEHRVARLDVQSFDTSRERLPGSIFDHRPFLYAAVQNRGDTEE